MSIQVKEFRWEKGVNDAKYIELLKNALDRQKHITNKALAKIRELSKESKSSGIPNGSDIIYRQDIYDLIDNWSEDMIAPDAFRCDVEDLHEAKTDIDWIPITEDLPKERGVYLVTDLNGDVVRYVFENTDESKKYWMRCAKAWLPKIKPYGGEKDRSVSKTEVVGRWIPKKKLVPLAADCDPMNYDNYDEKTHSEWRDVYYCSECGWESGEFTGGKFCKNCGSPMKGSEEFDAKDKDTKIDCKEPMYCDRNICFSNEYNGIGCEECIVTKSQKKRIIDIGTDETAVSFSLSNFAEHHFVVDGVPCSSMEGFLQSLKFADPEEQRQVCLLSGKEAKYKGKKKKWYQDQKLYWQGKEFMRDSEEYQDLIAKAFDALFSDDVFREALLSTGDAEFAHSVGKKSIRWTVLTEEEFCDQLYRLRNTLKTRTT